MNNETLKEYKTFLWKRWLIDVAIRAVKTFCEACASMITVGALISEINWLHVLSVSFVALVYTVLVNIYKIASDLDKANKMDVDNSVENVEK